MTTTTHPSAVERLAAALLATGLGSNLGIHRDAGDILAADPTLASDTEDGQALRLLRGALPEHARQDILTYTVSGERIVSVGYEYRVGPRKYRRGYGEGPTVAAAAKACREALEGAR